MFSDSTRLGFQAAVAVLLTVILSHVFHFERAYWAIITAMALVSQTFGESIKKAVERVLMTIVGGILGTVLYVYFQQDPMVLFGLMLAVLFFGVYFMTISYQTSILFITMFVVFLFGELIGWDLKFLEARIVETMIGAAVAVITTAMIFPMKQSEDIRDRLQHYLQLLSKNIEYAFHMAEKGEGVDQLSHYRFELIKAYSVLRASIKLSSYEMLFAYFSRKKLRAMVLQYGVLLHYVTSMMEVAPQVFGSEVLIQQRNNLESMQSAMQQNLMQLEGALQGKKWEAPLQTLPTLSELVSDDVKACWFDAYSFLYFTSKVNEALLELE